MHILKPLALTNPPVPHPQITPPSTFPPLPNYNLLPRQTPLNNNNPNHSSCTSAFWSYLRANPTPNIHTYPSTLNTLGTHLWNSFPPHYDTIQPSDNPEIITTICEFYFKSYLFAPTIFGTTLEGEVSSAHSNYQSAWMSWASSAGEGLTSVARHCVEIKDTEGAGTPLLYAATGVESCLGALKAQFFNETEGVLNSGRQRMGPGVISELMLVWVGVNGVWVML
ncbi:hypothetical protein QBC38DRAFT_458401 [Podospora fimiseda]|uniref:Uncharacterized protein n=1 Tax=Podospora fimiseda TaxID=252190 RepID=A0AAN7BIW1_9PEZI|nr:hypothetical protein QBC38DRAFT_458401 [Podospora fimiseda]